MDESVLPVSHRKSGLGLYELRQVMHLPSIEAANLLGISHCQLKRIAKDLGCRRWPHRRLESLVTLRTMLEEDDAMAQEEKEAYYQRIEQEYTLILSDFSHRFPEDLDILRNVLWKKRNYLKRKAERRRRRDWDPAKGSADGNAEGVGGAYVQSDQDQDVEGADTDSLRLQHPAHSSGEHEVTQQHVSEEFISDEEAEYEPPAQTSLSSDRQRADNRTAPQAQHQLLAQQVQAAQLVTHGSSGVQYISRSSAPPARLASRPSKCVPHELSSVGALGKPEQSSRSEHSKDYKHTRDSDRSSDKLDRLSDKSDKVTQVYDKATGSGRRGLRLVHGLQTSEAVASKDTEPAQASALLFSLQSSRLGAKPPSVLSANRTVYTRPAGDDSPIPAEHAALQAPHGPPHAMDLCQVHTVTDSRNPCTEGLPNGKLEDVLRNTLQQLHAQSMLTAAVQSQQLLWEHQHQPQNSRSTTHPTNSILQQLQATGQVNSKSDEIVQVDADALQTLIRLASVSQQHQGPTQPSQQHQDLPRLKQLLSRSDLRVQQPPQLLKNGTQGMPIAHAISVPGLRGQQMVRLLPTDLAGCQLDALPALKLAGAPMLKPSSVTGDDLRLQHAAALLDCLSDAEVLTVLTERIKRVKQCQHQQAEHRQQLLLHLHQLKQAITHSQPAQPSQPNHPQQVSLSQLPCRQQPQQIDDSRDRAAPLSLKRQSQLAAGALDGKRLRLVPPSISERPPPVLQLGAPKTRVLKPATGTLAHQTLELLQRAPTDTVEHLSVPQKDELDTCVPRRRSMHDQLVALSMGQQGCVRPSPLLEHQSGSLVADGLSVPGALECQRVLELRKEADRPGITRALDLNRDRVLDLNIISESHASSRKSAAMDTQGDLKQSNPSSAEQAQAILAALQEGEQGSADGDRKKLVAIPLVLGKDGQVTLEDGSILHLRLG